MESVSQQSMEQQPSKPEGGNFEESRRRAKFAFWDFQAKHGIKATVGQFLQSREFSDLQGRFKSQEARTDALDFLRAAYGKAPIKNQMEQAGTIQIDRFDTSELDAAGLVPKEEVPVTEIKEPTVPIKEAVLPDSAQLAEEVGRVETQGPEPSEPAFEEPEKNPVSAPEPVAPNEPHDETDSKPDQETKIEETSEDTVSPETAVSQGIETPQGTTETTMTQEAVLESAPVETAAENVEGGNEIEIPEETIPVQENIEGEKAYLEAVKEFGNAYQAFFERLLDYNNHTLNERGEESTASILHTGDIHSILEELQKFNTGTPEGTKIMLDLMEKIRGYLIENAFPIKEGMHIDDLDSLSSFISAIEDFGTSLVSFHNQTRVTGHENETSNLVNGLSDTLTRLKEVMERKKGHLQDYLSR